MNVKEDLEVEFKVMKYNNSDIISRKYFEDEKNKYWGECIRYSTNGTIIGHGFYANDYPIGMWKYYNEDGSIKAIEFFSFEDFWVEMDENKYKIELSKIRLGIWKVPALDLKISDYEH